MLLLQCRGLGESRDVCEHPTDGHTVLVPGLSSLQGQSRPLWLISRISVEFAYSRTDSCELGLETASLARMGIGSDEMWHMARLSFGVALAGAACKCRGTGTTQAQASGSAGCCRRSGVTVGLFPCRFAETPNVTALQGPKRGLRPLSQHHTVLYGDLLGRGANAQLSEHSSDATEDAAHVATLSTSP